MGDRAHLLRHSKFTALAVPKSATRLMASTAHTTSTCSRGTARMRPPRGRWAPDHVKLVLSRAVLIVPCRVVCRTLPHVMRPSSPPRTGSLSPARYARARRASLFSGGTARWSPSLARSRSRRRRVPQARRPSCGRWSRWRCGPRRSRRSSWPPLAAQIGANSRSRGSTDWRCSRGRRTRWPRTRSSTPTPSAWAISWSRRSGSGSSNASARASASLLHAARGRDAHHREPHGAAGGPALLARPGRPCGPPAEERPREARLSILYWPTDASYSLEACCSDTSLIELLWR